MFIKFNSPIEMANFVTIAEQFDDDIDIVSGRYVIDGKSLNGVFSMGVGKTVETYIHSTDEDVCNKFEQAMHIFMTEE